MSSASSLPWQGATLQLLGASNPPSSLLVQGLMVAISRLVSLGCTRVRYTGHTWARAQPGHGRGHLCPHSQLRAPSQLRGELCSSCRELATAPGAEGFMAATALPADSPNLPGPAPLPSISRGLAGGASKPPCPRSSSGCWLWSRFPSWCCPCPPLSLPGRWWLSPKSRGVSPVRPAWQGERVPPLPSGSPLCPQCGRWHRLLWEQRDQRRGFPAALCPGPRQPDPHWHRLPGRATAPRVPQWPVLGLGSTREGRPAAPAEPPGWLCWPSAGG